MRYFILAVFAALAVAAPIAGAKAVKATPTYSITAAKVSGKNVKFDISVTLRPNPATCSGSVSADYALSKRKSLKWTGKLKPGAVACAATIHGKLPKAKYGKKLKFNFNFPGNKGIKKFSGSKSLTITPPAPAPPPSGPTGETPDLVVLGPQKPGPWNLLAVNGNGDDMVFTIGANYKVPALIDNSGVEMTCDLGGKTIIPFNWSNTFFGMGAQLGIVTSGDSGLNTANMVYTLNWAFTDAHSGTGQFSASGDFRYDQGSNLWTHCTTGYAVTFSGGNP